MKIDEVINLAHVTSQGALAVMKAVADGSMHPKSVVHRDNDGNVAFSIGMDCGIPIPEGMSDEEAAAWNFGAGHAVGDNLLSSRGWPKPEFAESELASGAEGCAYRKGVVAGWDQGAELSEARRARRAPRPRASD